MDSIGNALIGEDKPRGQNNPASPAPDAALIPYKGKTPSLIAKADYISKKRQTYLIAIEFDDRVLDFDLLHLRSHRADMGGEHRGIRLGRGRRKGRTKCGNGRSGD